MAHFISQRQDKVHLTPLDVKNPSQVVRILQSPRVEILHVVVRVGEDIPTHEPQGEVILHCLVGCVDLNTDDASQPLAAGDIVLLQGNEPFSITAREHSSLLMTILEPRSGSTISLIGQTPDRPK